jgi:hypothetical protein
MSISYLSHPIESKVKPYTENVNLIAKVAQQKQNKYDQVLSAIFQKQNQLLNLDTLNEKVTAKKEDVLKQVDNQLNKLASSDLTIPDNISKVEGLFDPITSDKDILSDVYYTKQIRENQKFAEDILKKDPSVGNQTNYHTSQSLVEQYRKADLSQLSSAAPYATMFTPYIDVKTKKMDFLQKLGVIKDGYTNTVEIVTENGIKYVKTTSGNVPEAEVLSKFYASLTSEDKQQLVLDGYHDYGNADFKKFMPLLAQKQEVDLKEVSSKITLLDDRIKVLDANNDGKVDVEDEDMGTKQLVLNSYLSQKSFYSQKQKIIGNRGEYLKKYETNGDLVLGDRMNLFADLKTDELANDEVTLLSQVEPLKNSFTLDYTLAFNRETKMMEEDAKAKAEKAKKAAESPVLKNIDYNKDGITDFQTDAFVQETPITADDLQKESEVEAVQYPTFGQYTDKSGNKLPSKVSMSTYNIKDWKKLFDQIYTGKAVDGKIVATKMLGDMAINNEGVIDKTILGQITAEYQTYKDVITTGKKTDAQIEEDIVKNPKLKKFEDLRQLELNLSKAGSVGDIHKQVQDFIRDRWDEQIKKTTTLPATIGQLAKVFSKDAIKEGGLYAAVNTYYSFPNTSKGKKQVQDTIDEVLKALENVEVTDLDLTGNINDRIKTALDGKFDPMLVEIVTSIPAIESTLMAQKKKLPKHTLALRENDIQDIYKQLISKDTYLELSVSPPVAEGKKDFFYDNLNKALMKGVQDNKAKFKNAKGEEIEYSEIKDFENSFTTISFNTGTGVIKGSMGLQGSFEMQLTEKEGKDNNLPFGIPSDDLIGKQLFLQTHLAKLKDGAKASEISKQIPIGKIPTIGEVFVYYDAGVQKFKTGYRNKDKQLVSLPFEGSNTREVTMKFLQQLQSLGADASSFQNSAYSILN